MNLSRGNCETIKKISQKGGGGGRYATSLQDFFFLLFVDFVLS